MRTVLSHTRVAPNAGAAPGSRAQIPLTRRAFVAGAAGLALLAFAPSLAGCSTEKNIVMDDPKSAGADKQLSFFGFKYEPLNVSAIEEILHGYMDEHPGTSIVYEGIKSRPYFEALKKRLAAGQGDDVFMVDHDTALAFGEAGYLADLGGLDTIPSFSDLALGQMRSEGTINYVPTSISAFGLYCNTTLLAEHGVAVPRSLPEFERACQTFAAQGIVPLVANNDISFKTLALARGLAGVYAGGNAEARIEEFNADPAALAAALRSGFDAVERIVAHGWVDAPLALQTEKTADDLDQFATGAQPFMLTGAWASVRLHDLAPDLDYEVHPYPILDDGPALVVNVDTRVSVNANGAHLAEALDFVSYLTRPESIGRFANSQCSFSPLKGNAAPDDKALAPLSASFSTGNAVIGSDDNLRFPIWDAVRRCTASLLEGATAAEAESQLLALLAEGGDAAV